MEALINIIIGLKRSSCWCELGIGNPMLSKHSPACIAAEEAVTDWENNAIFTTSDTFQPVQPEKLSFVCLGADAGSPFKGAGNEGVCKFPPPPNLPKPPPSLLVNEAAGTVTPVVTELTVGKTYRIQQEGHRLNGETVQLESMKFDGTGKLAKVFVLVGICSIEEVPVGALVEV